MIRTTAVILLLLLVTASPSLAQVGVSFGEYGLGMIAQLGSRNVKLELGGGFTPILIFWKITYYGSYGSGGDDYLKFYLPGEVGAKLNFSLSDPEENRLGFKFGASYNAIMKTGFGGGVDYQIGKKLPYLTISGGLMYFPEAYDELLQRLNDDEGTDYTKEEVSAILIGFRPYIGLTLFFGG